jgi:hypothetical protein
VKKITLTIFSVSAIVVGIAVAMIWQYPMVFYRSIIERQVSHPYFPIKKNGARIVKASKLDFSVWPELEVQDPSLWRKYHIGHYLVQVPLQNPFFKMKPKIQYLAKNSDPLFGIELFTGDFSLGNEEGLPNQKETQFIYAQIPDWNINFYSMTKDSPDIFQWPALQSIIEKKSMDEIWKDLFWRDLSVLENKKLPLEEIVYQLYLYHLRNKFFPAKTKTIYMYESPIDKTIWGVLDLGSDEVGLKEEIVWEKRGNQILGFLLKTNTQNIAALDMRKKILSTITYQESHPRDAEILYREFQQIPFKNKLTRHGLNIYYFAWTHQIHNQNYLRGMIETLERAPELRHDLTPFYQFAFDQFGSDFSQTSKIEKAKALLKRAMAKEEEKYLEKLKANESDDPDNFSDPEEKINYFLLKAKESAVNLDQEKGRLWLK